MKIEVTFNSEKRSRCVYRSYEGYEAVMNEFFDSQQTLYHILIDFGNNKAVQKLMSKSLDCIDVHKSYHEEIIRQVTLYVQSQTWEDGEDSKKDRLYVNLCFISDHFHDERDVLQQSILEAEEDCEMTRAAVPAIRSLKTKRIEVDDVGDAMKCMVCLQDFVKGEKVTCMPCPHVFHGDCITKWLHKSHVCPVCRYEMPKASHV